MATETLEARVEALERRVRELEERLAAQEGTPTAPVKSGWRAIVGVHADNPHFEEVVRLGREWRFADAPKDEEDTE